MRAPNGRVVADGAEGYRNRVDCVRMLAMLGCRPRRCGTSWTDTSGALARARGVSGQITALCAVTDGAEDLDVPSGVAPPRNPGLPIRKFAERDYSTITHWSEFDRGGHFAAMEQPELYVGDLAGSTARKLGRLDSKRLTSVHGVAPRPLTSTNAMV